MCLLRPERLVDHTHRLRTQRCQADKVGRYQVDLIADEKASRKFWPIEQTLKLDEECEKNAKRLSAFSGRGVPA